jgi:hypothetical protein
LEQGILNLQNYLILDSAGNPINLDNFFLIKKEDYDNKTQNKISLNQLLSLLPDIQQ